MKHCFFLGYYNWSWRTSRWKSTYYTLWYWYVQVYLLWILSGGLPSRCHCWGNWI